MSAAQPNETEEILEVREKDGDSVPPLSTPKRTASISSKTHATAPISSSPESTALQSSLSSPPFVLPQGIKSSYYSDLDLLEDLWNVGLADLFDQGDIYVGHDGKTVCTGVEIMTESNEHMTLKDSIERIFTRWGTATGNSTEFFCGQRKPVAVSNKYINGEENDADYTRASARKPDVAVYSGERQRRGIFPQKIDLETITYARRGDNKRQKVLATKVKQVVMTPQLVIQIGVTNNYSTEKDNMDTLMNYAGVQDFIACERPNAGYYVKLLHNGECEETNAYMAYYGFLVIKVLRDNRMPSEENHMTSENSQVFEVNEHGEFGPNDIIEIDMMNEVGINVAENQRFLQLSLEELRRDLVEQNRTVFQQVTNV
jgi:hypothetical protein